MTQTEIVDGLKSLVEIESISSEEKHYKDVEKSAESVKVLFEGLGLESKISKSNKGMPAVLAQTEQDPNKKTVLLYAHHDVQPVGDLSLWETDPFTPEIIDGRMYGRGSGDNKAGVVTHYGVVKALKDDPPVNIKIFIEGEEEIGSPTMLSLIHI